MSACEAPLVVCTCVSCRALKCPGSNTRLQPELLSPMGDALCECGRLVGTYAEPHRITRRVAWHQVKGEQ